MHAEWLIIEALMFITFFLSMTLRGIRRNCFTLARDHTLDFEKSNLHWLVQKVIS